MKKYYKIRKKLTKSNKNKNNNNKANLRTLRIKCLRSKSFFVLCKRLSDLFAAWKRKTRSKCDHETSLPRWNVTPFLWNCKNDYKPTSKVVEWFTERKLLEYQTNNSLNRLKKSPSKSSLAMCFEWLTNLDAKGAKRSVEMRATNCY